MALDTIKVYSETNLTKPGRAGNRSNVPTRANVYGEQHVLPVGKARQHAADEGSYFVATNPTPGTGIAGIAATGAFSDLETLLLIRNTASDTDGTRLYMDFLEVIVTAAGGSGTDHRFASKLDLNVDRFTSGGSQITAVNPNSDSGAASVANVKFGALVTTAASSSARLIQNGLLRTVITVVGDRYIFDFGGDPQAPGHAIGGAAVADIVVGHVPVIIGPGDSFVFSLYATAQSGATSYEFNAGWTER